MTEIPISKVKKDRLLETLEILADPELSAAIQRGLAEVEAGEMVDHEEAWRGLDDPRDASPSTSP